MPLYIYSPFLATAATGDLDIDYCEKKISSRSVIIKTNAVQLNAKRILWYTLWQTLDRFF